MNNMSKNIYQNVHEILSVSGVHNNVDVKQIDEEWQFLKYFIDIIVEAFIVFLAIHLLIFAISARVTLFFMLCSRVFKSGINL